MENSFKTGTGTIFSEMGSDMYVTAEATGNCQLGTVALFNSWVETHFGYYVEDDENETFAYSTENARQKTQKLFRDYRKVGIHKRILLFDVNDFLEEWMDYTFKDYIITKAPYLSTNSSDMIIYLVNIEDFTNRKDFK